MERLGICGGDAVLKVIEMSGETDVLWVESVAGMVGGDRRVDWEFVFRRGNACIGGDETLLVMAVDVGVDGVEGSKMMWVGDIGE
jgi:hypothetical protein